MIQGRLEKLFAEGALTGWAWDAEAPAQPVAIRARLPHGKVIGEGLANLYRDELAEARIGLGWCGFRLRLASPALLGPIELIASTTGVLLDAREPAFVPTSSSAIGEGAEKALFDPFTVKTISQLRACEPLFQGYVRARGVDAFVRAAYVYLLGRAVDPENRTLHTAMLRNGAMSPRQLIEWLADTEEFAATAKTLAAPNTPGFPFVEATHAR
jgi:hypothetical protein